MEDKIEGYPTGFRFRIFQAAVLCLSLMLACVGVMGAIMGNLQEEFPDASTLMIQAFSTVPTICGMVANLVGGASAAAIGKKNLCLIGIACIFIGGFMPMFMPNLILIIVFRAIAGFGMGMLQPLSASLIVDCFEGETANIMMGFQSALVGAGASLFSYTIAAIMVYNWHYAYCCYLYCVAFFLLVLFGMPNFVNQLGKKDDTKQDSDQPRTKLPVSAYVGCAAQAVYGCGYGVMGVCMSLAAVEVGISTSTVAAISGFGGIVSLIGGLIFGWVLKVIKLAYIGPLGLVLNVIGFAIIGMTKTTTMWYVGDFLISLGFCWWMPYVNFVVNRGADVTNSAFATSMGFVGNSLGSFLAAYAVAAVGAILPGGLSQHQAFIFGAILIAVTFVGMLIYTIMYKDPEEQKA